MQLGALPRQEPGSKQQGGPSVAFAPGVRGRLQIRQGLFFTEGARVMGDLRGAAVGQDDFHDVESTGRLVFPVAKQVALRGAKNSSALGEGDGFDRGGVGSAATGLHFDEGKSLAVAHDAVDLSRRNPKVALDHQIAPANEPRLGDLLSACTELEPIGRQRAAAARSVRRRGEGE